MEHFKSPFGPEQLGRARARENRRFFEAVLGRAKNHRFFRHPFLSLVDDAEVHVEFVSFLLTSFYQIVAPFTGLLCSLGGRAPCLRTRFALMDNIFEEMGSGQLEAAHPQLYLKMLASAGVAEEAAEAMPTLPAIQRINEHLRAVVEKRPFSVGCALLASAESTIPPSFSVFSCLAQRAFPEVDMAFFDRHGPRDLGHANDASVLFSVSGDRADFAAVEAAVLLDLDYRSDLFDDWMSRRSSAAWPAVVEKRSGVPRPE